MVKQQIENLRSEHRVWKDILFRYYAFGGSRNKRVYISDYDNSRFKFYGVKIEKDKASSYPLYLAEKRCKDIKQQIKQLNRILCLIRTVNDVTEDRNYWRLKCEIQIGAIHLYPEFLRLQEKRREKKLPI